MAGQIISIVFTCFVMYVTRPGSSWFSWHPALMALAFAFLMPQAILVFHRKSSWMPKAARSKKLWFHIVLHSLAAVSAAAAFFVIYQNKEMNAAHHFTSWHSWIGISTLVWTVFQLLGGISAKYARVLFPANVLTPYQAKLYHATSGAFLASAGCLSLASAMFTTYFSEAVTGAAWYASVISVGLLALVLVDQVTKSYVK